MKEVNHLRRSTSQTSRVDTCMQRVGAISWSRNREIGSIIRFLLSGVVFLGEMNQRCAFPPQTMKPFEMGHPV